MNKINNKNSKKIMLIISMAIFGTLIIIGFRNFEIIDKSDIFRMSINIAGLIISFGMLCLGVYSFLRNISKKNKSK